MKTLVIFHKNCVDGFAAAWAAYRRLGDQDVEYLAASYGGEPPEVKYPTRVFVLDFSYPREQLLAFNKACGERLSVFDHHKTAREALVDLPFCTFDENRSGATLAWDHFHIGLPRPWIISYAEDRDLWRHKLPNTREINAAMQSWPKDFKAWDARVTTLDDDTAKTVAVVEGTAILRYIDQVTDEHCKAARIFKIDNQEIPVVNLHNKFASDTLAELRKRKNAPMAVGWFQRYDGLVTYSVRGVGAAELAQRHGGGGHAESAGFAVMGLPTDLWKVVKEPAEGASR